MVMDMATKALSGRQRSPGLLLGMLGLGLLFSAQLAAGDWKVSANISVKGTYTDNAGLSSSDKKDQFYAQVSPGVTVKREGAGRVQLSANYSLNYTGNRPGSRGRTVAHALASSMQAELYRDHLFLDAKAGARLSSVTSGGQRGGDSVGDVSDPVQTYTYSLSPYVRHRLGRYANILTRYTFDQVINSGERGLDSYSNQLLLSINSSAYFTRFPWSISYRQSKIGNEGGAADSKTSSINANIGYVFNRKWRLNLNGGKVDNDIQSRRSSTDSATWRAGVTWTPSVRTNVDFSYGKQMFGESFAFDLNHRWRRAAWRAGYTQTLTNSRSQQLAQTSSAVFSGGSAVGYSVTPRPYADYATLTDEYYVIETLNTGFTLGTRRSNLSVDAHFTRREYEVSGDKGRDIGINTSWSRQLSPKTDLKMTASWQKNRANENAREDTRWRWSLGLSRRLTAHTNANLDYNHRRLDSTTGTGEYRENQISLSFASRW